MVINKKGHIYYLFTIDKYKLLAVKMVKNDLTGLFTFCNVCSPIRKNGTRARKTDKKEVSYQI